MKKIQTKLKTRFHIHIKARDGRYEGSKSKMKRPSKNMFIELSSQLTWFKFNNVRWINAAMQISGPITYAYSRTSSKGTLTFLYYTNMSSASLGLL